MLVAALTREVAAARVQSWLEAQAAGTLVISGWVRTEVASALSLKLRADRITQEERQRASTAFAELEAENLSLLPVPPSAFRRASDFLGQHTLGLRAGDALHLGICSVHSATLCTLDRRLAEAATPLGITARLL